MYPFFHERYMDIKQVIRTVDDFPKPGVKFLDVTSILENASAFRRTINWLVKQSAIYDTDCVIAIDARGFIWGAALASEIQVPLFLARKPGKLPGNVVNKEYATEYSTASLSMLKDGNIHGKVMVVDDILATGGTLNAVGSMLTEHWNIPASDQTHCVIANLDFLPGRQLLTGLGYNLEYMVNY
jgi:adenine phosphoribosyltransferase